MLSHLIIIQTGHISMYDGIFITGLWNHGLILYQYGARCKGLVRRLLMLSLVMWIKELKNYSLTKQLCCFFCIWEFFVVFFFLSVQVSRPWWLFSVCVYIKTSSYSEFMMCAHPPSIHPKSTFVEICFKCKTFSETCTIFVWVCFCRSGSLWPKPSVFVWPENWTFWAN